MWSPNIKEPLVKMLCHGSATKSVAVDLTGKLVYKHSRTVFYKDSSRSLKCVTSVNVYVLIVIYSKYTEYLSCVYYKYSIQSLDINRK